MSARQHKLLLVAAVLAVSAGCSGPAAGTSPAPTDATPSLSAPMNPTSPAGIAEPTATHPACFTREQLSTMDLEAIAGWDGLCYLSDSGAETQIDQRMAAAAVRGLVGQAPHLIAFQEITRMANSPNGDLRVLRLVDERGYTYLVAPVAGKVVEMDPPSTLPAGNGPTRRVDELQRQAEALVLDQYPPFSALKPSLDFQAGSKSGGVYFFRWERALPGNTMMPALAQVGITETGEVFSYLNTLFYLPAGPPYPTLPAP